MTPDDPFITEMDPVQKMWMFYSWLEDRKDSQESIKDHAYMIGGFTNPEMLKKLLSDDGNNISTTDEDFEKSLEMVKQSAKDTEKEASLKKRKRRKNRNI